MATGSKLFTGTTCLSRRILGKRELSETKLSPAHLSFLMSNNIWPEKQVIYSITDGQLERVDDGNEQPSAPWTPTFFVVEQSVKEVPLMHLERTDLRDRKVTLCTQVDSEDSAGDFEVKMRRTSNLWIRRLSVPDTGTAPSTSGSGTFEITVHNLNLPRSIWSGTLTADRDDAQVYYDRLTEEIYPIFVRERGGTAELRVFRASERVATTGVQGEAPAGIASNTANS